MSSLIDENLLKNTPIITSSNAEGAGASSGYLDWISPTCRARHRVRLILRGISSAAIPDGIRVNVEAYCLALTKVYTFGPTFRAENSNTGHSSRRIRPGHDLEVQVGDRTLKLEVKSRSDFSTLHRWLGGADEPARIRPLPIGNGSLSLRGDAR